MGDAGHALANIERGLLLAERGSDDGYTLALRSSFNLSQSLHDCRVILLSGNAPYDESQFDDMLAYLTACFALASWCEWSLVQRILLKWNHCLSN